MDTLDLHKYLISKSRNIYTEAELFQQNRRPVNEFIDLLVSPGNPNDELRINGDFIISKEGQKFEFKNNVVDFRRNSGNAKEKDLEWERLNEFLVNYQRFLTPYTLINSLPIYSYIAERTGLNKLSNARVIDVGAGTGQIYGTFFYHQETLEYFLLDPNLRLIHDQFLRLYPKLTSYPINHILCYAEELPFKKDIADLVMSISSIDHFKDYQKFIQESHRVLKKDGLILIASHLDVDAPAKSVTTPKSLFKNSVERNFMHKVFNRLALKFEYLSRKYHNKKRGVVEDDHTHSFDGTAEIESALTNNGFTVLQSEVFQRNFYVLAKKSS